MNSEYLIDGIRPEFWVLSSTYQITSWYETNGLSTVQVLISSPQNEISKKQPVLPPKATDETMHSGLTAIVPNRLTWRGFRPLGVRDLNASPNLVRDFLKRCASAMCKIDVEKEGVVYGSKGSSMCPIRYLEELRV
jgi:hypothetical protein